MSDGTDTLIRAVDLKKVYRLYAKPTYRFLDMLGLLRNKPGAFIEHAALNNVSLEMTVTGGGLIAAGTATVGDGIWTAEPAAHETMALALANQVHE